MEKIPSPELIYTGTQVNYYFVCKRKLWLFPTLDDTLGAVEYRLLKQFG